MSGFSPWGAFEAARAALEAAQTDRDDAEAMAEEALTERDEARRSLDFSKAQARGLEKKLSRSEGFILLLSDQLDEARADRDKLAKALADLHQKVGITGARAEAERAQSVFGGSALDFASRIEPRPADRETQSVPTFGVTPRSEVVHPFWD